MEAPPVAHVNDSLSQTPTIEMQSLESAQHQPERPRKKRQNWWQQHVAQDVPLHECRDHYGSLALLCIFLKKDVAMKCC